MGEKYHKRVGSFIGKMLENPNEQGGDKLTLKLNSLDQHQPLFGHGLPSNGGRTIHTQATHTRYNSIKLNDGISNNQETLRSSGSFHKMGRSSVSFAAVRNSNNTSQKKMLQSFQKLTDLKGPMINETMYSNDHMTQLNTITGFNRGTSSDKFDVSLRNNKGMRFKNNQ